MHVAGVGEAKSVNITTARWTDLTPNLTSLTTKRYGSSLAYDPLTNESYLFGGYNDTAGLLNQTWKLNGSAWSLLKTPVAPSPRYLDSPMVYDPAERGVVLFGGLSGIFAYSLNDTWLFNGTVWKNLSLTLAPSASAEGEMTWDPALSGLLYFLPTTPAQTWLFHQGAWSELNPTREADATGTASMTYDTSDGCALLFGGYSHTWVNWTWEFANNTWTNVTPTSGPTGRLDAKLVYDNATNSAILFGGLTAAQGYQQIMNDTWSFHAGVWTLLAPPVSPEGLWLSAATYDSAEREILLVNGQNVNGGTVVYDWAFHGAQITINASVSSTRGFVPLKVWMNSTVSPLGNGTSVSWSVSNGFVSSGLDAVATITTAGTFTAAVTVTVPQAGAANLSFAIVVVVPVYSLTFVESGLPSRTYWSVAVAGTSHGSASPSIAFNETNGNYSYSIAAVVGYGVPNPSGSVEILGANRTVRAPFAPLPPMRYNVTFSESGLPSGTAWSVTLNGTAQTTTTPQVVFAEVNGTYSYRISFVPGYSSNPDFGNIMVIGLDRQISVRFTILPIAKYPVTFNESGLSVGTAWSVSIAGTTHRSGQSSVIVDLANGSYNYSVSPEDGFQVNPGPGSVVVNGLAVNVSVQYLPLVYGGPPGPIPEGLWSGGWLLPAVVVALGVAVVVVVVLLIVRRRRAASLPSADPDESTDASSTALDEPGDGSDDPSG